MELLMLLFLVGGVVLVGAFVIIQQVWLFGAALFYARYYYARAEFTGARRWPVMRRLWLWKVIRDIYRHRVVMTMTLADEIPSTTSPPPLIPLGSSSSTPHQSTSPHQQKNVIYGCHRHEILALSAAMTFLVDSHTSTAVFGKVSLAIHSLHFMIPFWADLAVWMGCIDVSKDSILAALARGENVAIIPGGVKEMGMPYVAVPTNRTDRTFSRAVLVSEGFLRIAYQHRCAAAPVYLHNENQVCWSWHGEPRWVTRLRYRSAKLIRYPFPTFFMPCLPWKVSNLITYVGNVIKSNDYSTFEQFRDAYGHELERLMDSATKHA